MSPLRSRWLPLVLVMGLTSTDMAAGQSAPTGSSKQMIARMKQSMLVRHARLFFPSGSKATAKPPDPSDDIVPSLESDIKGLLAALASHHGAKATALAGTLSATFRPVAGVRARVLNIEPVAEIEPDGFLRIDARVLGALLVASMSSAMTVQGKPPTTEDLETTLQGLRTFADEIQTEKGRTLAGDVLKSGSFELFGRIQQYQVVMALDDVYFGALAFVIAHELGHYVLRHEVIAAGDAAPCDTFGQQELQADRYAALLLSEYFMGRSVTTVGVAPSLLRLVTSEIRGYVEVRRGNPTVEVTYVNEEKLRSFAGYVTFFNEGFDRVGLRRDLGGCVYPQSTMRVEKAEEALVSALMTSSERVVRNRKKLDQLKSASENLTSEFRGITSLFR